MSGPTEHAGVHRLVDEHFAGRLPPGPAREMHQHLLTCRPCAGYYERRSFVNRLDPKGRPREELIALGLGLGRRRSARWTQLGLAFAVLAPLAGVLLWLRAAEAPDDGFRARGASAATARLLVYRLRGSGPAERVRGTIAADDELAFAYQNPGAFQRLLVFGVDAKREVYWYHPAWIDPARPPEAVKIQGGSEVRELQEGVRFRLGPGPLHVYAVFTNRPYTVEDAERAVARAASPAPRPLLADSLQVVEVLQVAP